MHTSRGSRQYQPPTNITLYRLRRPCLFQGEACPSSSPVEASREAPNPRLRLRRTGSRTRGNTSCEVSGIRRRMAWKPTEKRLCPSNRGRACKLGTVRGAKRRRWTWKSRGGVWGGWRERSWGRRGSAWRGSELGLGRGSISLVAWDLRGGGGNRRLGRGCRRNRRTEAWKWAMIRWEKPWEETVKLQFNGSKKRRERLWANMFKAPKTRSISNFGNDTERCIHIYNGLFFKEKKY